MQRPHSLTDSARRALVLASALCAVACAGTPLPEPPDELPRPDFDLFAQDAVGVVSLPELPPLMLAAGPGAVQANSSVWIINLDVSGPPVQAMADAEGGFKAPAVSASPSDRVRVIARTERQHSAPLDLRTIMRDFANAPLEAAPLAPTELSCLSVTPGPTLVLRGSAGTLRLSNECGVAVDLTRVSLRFGDQGLSVSKSPARLGAGQRSELTISDSRGPAASERLDIVLIDAQASDGRQGRYAIDVFSALD
jgi:hypothetical protein